MPCLSSQGRPEVSWKEEGEQLLGVDLEVIANASSVRRCPDIAGIQVFGKPNL